MPEQRRPPAGAEHDRYPRKAWDCGYGQHLEARGEEALIVRVIYHLEVEHPEAHFTLEQAEEFVATEAYEAL